MSDDDNNSNEQVRGNVAQTRIQPFTSFLIKHERIFNVLSTIVTAVFTAVLATSTVFLWKETKDLRDFAKEQSNDMKASIAEAARSAIAMRDVAAAVGESVKAANESVAAFKDATARQMRAYLTIGLGSVIKQSTETNYRFEIRMVLQNVGNTPAYKVATVSHVDVLPFPFPSNFQFPAAEMNMSETVVGPHQNFIVTGYADRIYPDDDVTEISTGMNKRLYIYGTIAYVDAYGASHRTNFCQAILWLKNDTFMSLNTPSHNDAD